MHRECFDDTEREGGAADTAAGKTERRRTPPMQGTVQVLAGDIVSDRRFVRMNRIGFGAQRRFGIEEFGYGIERRHGNTPKALLIPSIEPSGGQFNQSGKSFKCPVKGLDL